VIDLNSLALDGPGGLLEALEGVPDPRARRGVRHRLASLLAVAAAATLAGARSFTAIGEYAGELSQEALARPPPWTRAAILPPAGGSRRVRPRCAERSTAWTLTSWTLR